MPDITEILAVASDPSNHREATVRILLDERLRNRHRELLAELEQAVAEYADNILKPQHVQDLGRKVNEAANAVHEAELEFRFRAMPGRKWLDLVAQHPLTAQQRKDGATGGWNPDTFEPAALAASCVDPEMTVEQAAEMRSMLLFDTYLTLWKTCLEVNGGDGGPKASPLASVILRRSGPSSPLVTTTESPDPSSSGEL